MGTFRIFARSSLTAFATAALLAGPSHAQAAQSADLAVTFPAAPAAGTKAADVKPGDVTSFAGFVPVADADGILVAPTALSFGKTLKYVFTVANNGPNHATGVAVDIVPPTGTSVTAVSGATCSKDADGNLDLTKSCAISADMPNGATPVNVTVTVKLDVPKTAPATCPGGTALGTFTATVVTDTNTTDPAPANNVATVDGTAVKFDPYTDVAIALDGPAFGQVGQAVLFTTTVTNNGPCPAENVTAVLVPGSLLTFESGTSPCTDFATDSDPKKGCSLGTLAPKATTTFTTTYKIAALPSDVTQTTIPNEVDVATDTTDVNGDNDVATTGTRVGKEGGGCSSGGPGGLLAVALMAAAVFAARRRRTA